MSDTPRTDEEYCRGRTAAGSVSINFARQLERELAALQRMLDDCYEAQRIAAAQLPVERKSGPEQGESTNLTVAAAPHEESDWGPFERQ